MSEETFERDLRAALAMRDPGPAPAHLEAVVRQRLATDPRPRRLQIVATPLASIALVAAAVIIAIVVSRPIEVGPGSAPGPSTLPHQIAPGDGVVTDVPQPITQAVTALIACAVLFLTALQASRRRTRIGASLAALLILVVCVTIGTSDALGDAGMFGVTPTREPGEGETGAVLSVTGDDAFTVLVSLRNTSRLPLTILGIADGGTIEVGSGPGAMATLPRFAGVGFFPGMELNLATILPFHPRALDPGAEVHLALRGLAGTCAVATRPPSNDASYEIREVPLVYEQLTITHTQTIRFVESIHVPSRMPCP
ncbi:MAG: hypothetical protein H0U52_18810 [Chloroflexi bacterium]|nr:hypothetical protein [Chloroflexota bacterium]